MTENANETLQTAPQTNGSTLIEFPGAHRNRPAWRKELSERFREIQQKRAREAALEAEGTPHGGVDAGRAEYFDANAAATPKASAEAAKQLGLVPPQPAEASEMNPIVQAALRRIERARRPEMSPPHAGRGGSNRASAATAAARVFEEQPEPAVETRPELVTPNRAEARHASPAEVADEQQPARAEQAEAAEAARASSLSVVAPKPAKPAQPEAAATAAEATTSEATTKTEEVTAAAASKSAPAAKADAQAKTEESVSKALDSGEAAAAVASTDKPQPRRIAGVIDDHWLERQGVETLPKVETVELTYDDRAPRHKRFAAAVLDLLVVAFLSAPFAAVIELTIGNWGDTRVWGSMAGIVAVLMFLYLTCSLALASRTLGMKLFSMHAVDANTAHAPTTAQCARRALVYMLSLATFGLGILYALFDAEGRTAHDLLSRTVVVKQ